MPVACFTCAVPIALRCAVSESTVGSGLTDYDFNGLTLLTDVAGSIRLGMTWSRDCIGTLVVNGFNAGFTDTVGAAL